MRNWKIMIELNGKKMEIFTKATSYAEAFIYAEIHYPGCVVKSISEIRE
jgi:hypothetical protein